ncbi:hypothetical protein ACA910_008102 [Epithemia clementina (nom. ined.)]
MTAELASSMVNNDNNAPDKVVKNSENNGEEQVLSRQTADIAIEGIEGTTVVGKATVMGGSSRASGTGNFKQKFALSSDGETASTKSTSYSYSTTTTTSTSSSDDSSSQHNHKRSDPSGHNKCSTMIREDCPVEDDDDSSSRDPPPTITTTTNSFSTVSELTDSPLTTTTATTTVASSLEGSVIADSGALKHKKSASEWKEEGNKAFTAKRYRQALEAYDQGLQMLGDYDRQPQNKNRDSEDDYYAARTSILSNRAMALIKLEDYAAAEESCSRVLEHHNDNLREREGDQDNVNNSNRTRSRSNSHLRLYKVWFRRAVARENRAKEMPLNSPQQHELIQSAKADLQASLQLLEQDDTIQDKERALTKRTVAEAASRIQRLLIQIKRQEQQQQRQRQVQVQVQQLHQQQRRDHQEHGQPPQLQQQEHDDEQNRIVMSTNQTIRKTARTRSPTTNNPSDPLSQKNVVMELLESRITGMLQQYQKATAAHGEAFFLLDWHWWSKFCRYVDLFGKMSSKEEVQVLSYLPRGTTIPDQNDSEEQGDENGGGKRKGQKNRPSSPSPPGPIDNSNLFLLSNNSSGAIKTTRQVFNEQWFLQAKCDNETDQLKPNLVRGYHYEIIPREVYVALREWYTEVTPPICRRAMRDPKTGQVSVPLYIFPDPRRSQGSNLHTNHCGACQAPLNVKLRCTRCLAVYYCDRGCQENHWLVHKPSCRVVTKLDNNKQVTRKPTLSHGRVGLNNLGNTCFMNAALQCLSHATPLTRHFLSGKFKQDLNKSNPLGTGGKLAMAYETVLKDLWMKVGIRSTSPNALKRAISQFAPRFAGFLQHDAQEFLAYLLDGLHEDVNRIRKAPYVEMPDVDGRQDMAAAGALAWDAHKRRNDSLVMDSFYGQFKSTCVCPQCNRVSVSFDAFNHVSLEIPQEQTAIVSLSVFVVRACNPAQQQVGSRPTRYAIHVRRSNPISEVIRELSKLTGIPRTRLHLSECQDREIVRLVQEQEMVSSLNQTNLLIAYEAESLDDGPGVTPSFHAVLRHKVVAPKDHLQQSDRTANDPFIGFPLLVSWPMNWTCRQVWEYLWHVVEDKVDEAYRDQYKEAMEFRLHNGKGKGVAVFPDLMGPQQDGTLSKRTSILPRQSDEGFLSFVGNAAVEEFLFIHVEWTDLAEGKSGQDATNGALDEDRFVAWSSHSSWQEFSAKRRAAQSNKGGVSLDQCFDTFVKPERLDERNMWYCSNCKEHVRAMKTMELWRLPNILVVHLKRFEFKNVLRRDKLETLVNFPLDGLDMGAHCGHPSSNYNQPRDDFVDDSVPAVYDLFAVVNHYGRMGFGHYTAFARNWDEQEISRDWQLFDDSTVRDVGQGDSVVSSAAYVLFYRRRIWS